MHRMKKSKVPAFEMLRGVVSTKIDINATSSLVEMGENAKIFQGSTENIWLSNQNISIIP